MKRSESHVGAGAGMMIPTLKVALVTSENVIVTHRHTAFGFARFGSRLPFLPSPQQLSFRRRQTTNILW